jgi:hypothetical protein
MGLLSLLITILVLCLVFSLLWYAIGLLPLPAPLAPVRSVLYIVLILVAVVYLLSNFGVFGGHGLTLH